MEKFSQVMARLISLTFEKLSEAMQKAVPAVNYRRNANRWRMPGQSLTPYHFMRAIPVPVRTQEKRK